MMKRTKLYSVIVTGLMALCSYGQDFAKVDNIVKSYPTTYNSMDRLASRINSDFSRDDEKARAIFTWIARNIRYDNSPEALGAKPIKYSYSTESERLAKVAEIENDLASRTLRSKKAVCHGYAMLYKIVAAKTGLESTVIYGTAKIRPQDIGKSPDAGNHAWNAVKLNGQLKLLDVTWGAGGMTGGSSAFNISFDDKYFLTSPEVFFLNHYPTDKKWLLTDKSPSDFAALPLYYDLGYELVSPDFGMIKTNGSGLVPFRIKGIKPTDEVADQFTSGRFSKKVTPVIKNGIAEFGVLFDATARGTLTIFVNKTSIAAYNVAR